MKLDEFFNPDLPSDLNQHLLRICHDLQIAQQALRDDALEFARAENEYRKNKATAYLVAKSANPAATIPMLEAMIDKECSRERERAFIARANKEASFELVRSLRAQLTAIQTISANLRVEKDLGYAGEPA